MRRLVLGFAVSIVALIGFLYVFDPVAMYHEVERLALVPFGAGLVAVFLAVACWGESMRRVLHSAGGSVASHRGFAAYSVGMFVKQILPMGNAGGVPIMALAIDREAGIGFNRSLAVVTVGDFLGLLSSLFLAVVGVVYVLLLYPHTRLLQLAMVFVAIFATVLVSLGALLLFRRAVLRYLVLGVARLLHDTLGQLSGRIESRLAAPAIEAGVDRYFDTFDEVRGDRRSLAGAAGLALLGWTLFTVPLYSSAIAVGESIPFGLVLFIVPVGGIATLVPLPGGLGGVEFAIAGMIVGTTTIDLAVVGAIVLLYRACVYWFPVLIGLMAVIYTGTSLRDIDRGQDEFQALLEEARR